MKYNITQADECDLPEIYGLFDEAIHFIKKNNYTGWTSYDKQFLRSEVERKLLFKVIKGAEIACIFSVCFNDALIWREKEEGNAVYLHRIVANRKFAGERLFEQILHWATILAINTNLKYIRLDTWAENKKIINYYKTYGFSFIEDYTTPGTDELPEQHRNLCVALLEKEIV